MEANPFYNKSEKPTVKFVCSNHCSLSRFAKFK